MRRAPRYARERARRVQVYDPRWRKPGLDMSVDRFSEHMAEVARLARAASDALEGAAAGLNAAGEERRAGASISTVVDALLAGRGQELRLGVVRAFRGYEQAAAALRGALVRALVDDEGMTFSEIARRISVSRQAVARMYHAAGAARS